MVKVWLVFRRWLSGRVVTASVEERVLTTAHDSASCLAINEGDHLPINSVQAKMQ